MTFSEIKQKNNSFEGLLGLKKAKLAEAKQIEIKRTQLIHLLEESNAILEFLNSQVLNFKLLNEIVNTEERSFKERRLGFLEGCLTSQMEYIFPKKKLRAKINCNFNRNKMKLRLNIVDPAGHVRPPSKTEGKLNQQLISVTAAYGCTKLLNKNILYMDEPFSNSSEDNLIKLQKMLNQFVEEGFQLILISQSPLLFADMSRRVIKLRSSNGVLVDRIEHEDIDHLEGG